MSDLVAVRGDTEIYDLTVATPSGAAVDLTGSDLWFTVKKRLTDPDPAALIRKETGAGITIADQVTNRGQAAIQLDPVDTEKIVPGTYYFDVQMKNVPGSITTLANGSIDITADVTRSTT